MRDARGQHPRLAGARARQHQERPVERLDRLALLRVQPFEIGRPGRSARTRRNAARPRRGRIERDVLGVLGRPRRQVFQGIGHTPPSTILRENKMAPGEGFGEGEGNAVHGGPSHADAHFAYCHRMPIDPESHYPQLGRLVEAMPDLTGGGPYPATTLQWLGRVNAFVSALNDPVDIVALRQASDNASAFNDGSPHSQQTRLHLANKIATILYRALAVAEMQAPVGAQGAFIPVASPFDAFAAIGKVLGGAKAEVLVIDPYMDEKVLTDFAPLASENVAIRLLADQQVHKPSLVPAVGRWKTQYGAKRPLEVRLAPARSLNDRLIITDNTEAWVLTQSLNAFADRSPASIIRVDPETAALKASAYQNIWTSATIVP